MRGRAKRSGNKAELHIGNLVVWPIANRVSPNFVLWKNQRFICGTFISLSAWRINNQSRETPDKNITWKKSEASVVKTKKNRTDIKHKDISSRIP